MKKVARFDCYEASFHFEPPVVVPSDMLIDSLGAIVAGFQVRSQALQAGAPAIDFADSIDLSHRNMVDILAHHDIDPLEPLRESMEERLDGQHAVTFIDYRR